ncbi:segregation/condensation protein A, partial [Candidatus Wolfebacteria bacterium]|nr:segregation/condensation protein A [Candidatus Wolfebacteria bacterium]
MYELKLQQFSGPLEKLLELIEGKKMEITDLNLAEVTADFLRYLKTLANADSRILADFIVVAGRLLLIKSKALLPSLELTNEEEQDILDLKDRITRYQQFKPAMILFKKLYEQNNFSVSRPLFYNFAPVFYPAKNMNIQSFNRTLNDIFEIFKKITLDSQKIEMPLIKLEEKIEEIVRQIKNGINGFNELTKEKSRMEIIVLFLALLHLLRDQIIKA